MTLFSDVLSPVWASDIPPCERFPKFYFVAFVLCNGRGDKMLPSILPHAGEIFK